MLTAGFKIHLADLGAEGDRGCVPADADADDPFGRGHPRQVEYIPSGPSGTTQETLEHSLKILWFQSPCVRTDIASRYSECSAERDAQMNEIATDARASQNGIVGGGQCIRGAADIAQEIVVPAC